MKKNIFLIWTTLAVCVFVNISFAGNINKAQYFNYALKKFQAGDNKTAIAYLDKLIAADPAFVEAYLLRGSARGILNNYQGALKDFDSFLEGRKET